MPNFPGPGLQPSAPLCPQCNKFHPPLQPGEKCPLVTKDSTPSGQEVDFKDLYTPLRNVILSKVQSKGIKDIKKLFGSLIVVITKHLEDYKE